MPHLALFHLVATIACLACLACSASSLRVTMAMGSAGTVESVYTKVSDPVP